MNLLDDSYLGFVNLPHRVDRLNWMEGQLARLDLKALKHRGMYPHEYRGDKERVKVMQNRTPGAIGCWHSQISVMESAALLSKHAFVMEDDLIFCSDFHKRMEIISEFLSYRDWDVFWFGGTFHVNPPWWHKDRQIGVGRDAVQTDHPRFMQTFGAFSTHAYLVNRCKIGNIIRLLDEIEHLSMGIDWAFIQLQPNLKTFAFVPGCIIQRDNQSDIGKGITKFSGFSKLGPYWFQDKMEDFDPTTFNWAEAKR